MPPGTNTPATLLPSRLAVAADNLAFTGFNPTNYRRMLDKLEGWGDLIEFVAVPDVVGAALDSLLFPLWAFSLFSPVLSFSMFLMKAGAGIFWSALLLPLIAIEGNEEVVGYAHKPGRGGL